MRIARLKYFNCSVMVNVLRRWPCHRHVVLGSIGFCFPYVERVQLLLAPVEEGALVSKTHFALKEGADVSRSWSYFAVFYVHVWTRRAARAAASLKEVTANKTFIAKHFGDLLSLRIRCPTEALRRSHATPTAPTSRGYGLSKKGERSERKERAYLAPAAMKRLLPTSHLPTLSEVHVTRDSNSNGVASQAMAESSVPPSSVAPWGRCWERSRTNHSSPHKCFDRVTY